MQTSRCNPPLQYRICIFNSEHSVQWMVHGAKIWMDGMAPKLQGKSPIRLNHSMKMIITLEAYTLMIASNSIGRHASDRRNPRDIHRCEQTSIEQRNWRCHVGNERLQ